MYMVHVRTACSQPPVPDCIIAHTIDPIVVEFNVVLARQIVSSGASGELGLALDSTDPRPDARLRLVGNVGKATLPVGTVDPTAPDIWSEKQACGCHVCRAQRCPCNPGLKSNEFGRGQPG